MDTQVQETIGKLKYVRGLLDRMGALNAEQKKAESRLGGIQAIDSAPVKRTSKVLWGVLVIAVSMLYLLAACFVVKIYADSRYSLWDDQYEAAVWFDEEMWNEEHGGETDPPAYPGYRGPLKEHITYGEAVLMVMNEQANYLLLPPLVIGIIIFAAYKARVAEWRTKIKKHDAETERILRHNDMVVNNNIAVNWQIQDVKGKKGQVSREFLENAGSWFPREYCYYAAVDFFIHELQFGMASTLGEAVRNYREEMHRRYVEKKLDELAGMLSIVIDNQAVIVSTQEALLRQQMIGTFISCATWEETRRASQSITDMSYRI